MPRELNLVLVRHGEAGEASADEYRALTEAGRRQVRAVGALFAAQPEPVDVVITSPLVRAVQTAETLAGALGLDGPITARPEIAFPARIEQVLAVADEVPGPTRGVMLVGHEPTMGVLARALTGEAGAALAFRTGTLVLLRWTRGEPRARPVFQISGRPPALERLGP